MKFRSLNVDRMAALLIDINKRTVLADDIKRQTTRETSLQTRALQEYPDDSARREYPDYRGIDPNIVDKMMEALADMLDWDPGEPLSSSTRKAIAEAEERYRALLARHPELALHPLVRDGGVEADRLATSPVVAPAQPHTTPGDRPALEKRPGAALASVLSWLFCGKTYDRVFEPMISDLRMEWVASVTSGRSARAHWIRLSYFVSVIVSVGILALSKPLELLEAVRKLRGPEK